MNKLKICRVKKRIKFDLYHSLFSIYSFFIGHIINKCPNNNFFSSSFTLGLVVSGLITLKLAIVKTEFLL